MKTLKKIFFVGSLTLGVFVLPQISRASLFATCNVSSTELNFSSDLGNTIQMVSGIPPSGETPVPVSLYSEDVYITNVNSLIRIDSTLKSNHPDHQVWATLTDSDWIEHNSEKINFSDLTTTGQALEEFNFSSSTSIHLNSKKLRWFKLHSTDEGSDFAGLYTGGSPDADSCQNWYHSTLAHNFYFEIYYSGAAESLSINFDSNSLYEGKITADFYAFPLVIENNLSTSTLFNWAVKWGTSTPDYYYSDIATDFGYTSLNLGINLASVEKSPTSTPGSYKAQAFLYSSVSTSTPIAQSSIINFTINNKPRELYPTDQLQVVNQTNLCNDTAWVVGGVDFGKGVCKAVSYLFWPGTKTIQNYSNLGELISTKIPFSYITEIKTMLENASISTTSTSTLPSITLQTSSTSPMQFSADLFSGSTITSAPISPFLNTMRTLGVYMLWAYCGMKLFDKVKDFTSIL